MKSKFLSVVCMAVACASAEQPQTVSPILTGKDLPPGIILIEGKSQGVRPSPGSSRIFQDESISSADYKNQFASGGHLCAKDGRMVIGNDIRVLFTLAPKTNYDLKNSQTDCMEGRRGKEVGSLDGAGIVFCKIYDNSNDKDRQSFYAVLIGDEKIIEASMSGDNEVYIDFWRVESKKNPDFDKSNVINTTVPTVDMMKAILRNLVPKVSSRVASSASPTAALEAAIAAKKVEIELQEKEVKEWERALAKGVNDAYFDNLALKQGRDLKNKFVLGLPERKAATGQLDDTKGNNMARLGYFNKSKEKLAQLKNELRALESELAKLKPPTQQPQPMTGTGQSQQDRPLPSGIYTPAPRVK